MFKVTKRPFLGASVLFAAASAMIAGTSSTASAASPVVDLRAGLSVQQAFPLNNGAMDFRYNARVSADRLTSVFEPLLKRWILELVPAGASAVTIRVVVPGARTIYSVQPLNGFTCSTAANVITCSGNVPATGIVNAVTIAASAQPGGMLLYPATATVDPFNTIAESSETNNTTTTWES